MKKTKKILACILVATLLAALFGLSAYAACEHVYSAGVYHAPTCTERGYMEYTCTICNETVRDGYVDASGHFYGEWQTVRASTCTENGLEKRVCRVCSGTETRTADLLAHADADNDGFCDACLLELNPVTDGGISPHDWLVMAIRAFIAWLRAIFA